MKERAVFPKDFWEQGKFLFYAPTVFDEGVANKKWNDDAVKVLTSYSVALTDLQTFDALSAKATLEKVTTTLGIAIGKILQALRLSITGVGGGPDLMIVMEIIGKEEVIKRIDYALKTLNVKVA